MKTPTPERVINWLLIIVAVIALCVPAVFDLKGPCESDPAFYLTNTTADCHVAYRANEGEPK